MDEPIELPWTREDLERAQSLLEGPADAGTLEAIRIVLRPLIAKALELMAAEGR